MMIDRKFFVEVSQSEKFAEHKEVYCFSHFDTVLFFFYDLSCFFNCYLFSKNTDVNNAVRSEDLW